MRLGVIYHSQATNRKQGGLTVRAPSPCRTPIGRMTPSRLEYSRTLSKTGGSYDFLIEKSPKTAYYKNLEHDIILKHSFGIALG